MDETNSVESTDVETLSTEPAALAAEGTDPAIPDESVPETTTETIPETTVSAIESTVDDDPEELDGTLATIHIYGDDAEYQETTAATEELVIVEVIESVGSDISHATLFSGFLVCGTLVGLALLRKINDA